MQFYYTIRKVKKKSLSVCIPVYDSEAYLEECLKSVADQTFTDYEVIVVNDGSSGVDASGNNCKKIIKLVKKKYNLSVNYIVHSENKGLLEARRTAVYEAKGDYICLLDSDDKLPPNALEELYNVAKATDADIVHGKGRLFINKEQTECVDVKEEELRRIWKEKTEKIQKIFFGTLENEAIFNSYLVDKNHCGFLWGKLIKREVYLEAFNNIPPMFCTMAEDFIQYFWLTYFAKKYVGIDKEVYYYCDNTGVTSNRVINNLDKWNQVCSVSSVFTALYTTLEERNIELTERQTERLTEICYYYVANNLGQLQNAVVTELKDAAYDILCDYWGANLVSKVENRLAELKNK